MPIGPTWASHTCMHGAGRQAGRQHCLVRMGGGSPCPLRTLLACAPCSFLRLPALSYSTGSDVGGARVIDWACVGRVGRCGETATWHHRTQLFRALADTKEKMRDDK